MARGGKREGAGRKKGSKDTRPRSSPVIIAARQFTDAALKALAAICIEGQSEAARVSAACALLDRGFGKPTQQLETGSPGEFSRMTDEELEAHIAEYPESEHAALHRLLSIGDAWNPDRVIVLTSSTNTIEKHIRLRNRDHEEVENMVRRFRLIDGEFRRLAPLYPNTIVIDRDRKEFHERDGLVDIIKAAGLPMFREIAYRRR